MADEIERTLSMNNIEKFTGVVTDGAGNVKIARQIINQKYPYILNLRCITHSINLMTKDIVDKPKNFKWGYDVLHNCSKIISFFKHSHQANYILNEAIKKFEISGGGLKSYIKTRWSSAWDCLYSVKRLENCFIWVKIFDITLYNIK